MKAITGFSALAVVLVLSLGVKREFCERCLVQQYVRSIFGLEVDALSEYEYDELGTFAEFVEQCGIHEHMFSTMSSSRGFVFQSKREIELAELAQNFSPSCGTTNGV